MCRFIESICCIDGTIKQLDLHQNRVNRTFSAYFKEVPIVLSDRLVDLPKEGKLKLRVVYDTQIRSLEYLPYTTPTVNFLKIVECNALEYSFKNNDRKELAHAFQKRGKADDIIISKNGLLTDAYFANLAFYDGQRWFTPAKPLLKGTKREKYLAEDILIKRDIFIHDISQYEKVSLINAMLDLSELEIDIAHVS